MVFWTRPLNFSKCFSNLSAHQNHLGAFKNYWCVCLTCRAWVRRGFGILKTPWENLIWSQCWESWSYPSLSCHPHGAGQEANGTSGVTACVLRFTWVLEMKERDFSLRSYSDSDLYLNGSSCCLALTSQFRSPSSCREELARATKSLSNTYPEYMQVRDPL